MSEAFPVHVERTPEGDYLLTWTESFSDHEVDVGSGSAPEAAAHSEPVVRGVRSGVRLAGIPDEGRRYFHLRPAHGEAMTAAERVLPLEAATNFRDLGGYRTDDGRRVRWGRLFRSGHTAELSERDVAYLDELDIRVCCDFRRQEEHYVEPSRLPPATRIVGVTVDPGSSTSFFSRLAAGGVSPAEMASFMEDVNREFVRHHSAQFRRMFEELLALADGAFMINCAAGKDRTGFGAAMILAALGVPEETVVADYLLSGRYFPIERELTRVRRKYAGDAGRALDEALVLPMMQTRREYIEAALAAIREDYGTLGRFLAEALGVDAAVRRELRERLTA